MKKLLLLLIIPFLSFGQGWEQTFGGPQYEEIASILQIDDGYIILGSQATGDELGDTDDMTVYLIKSTLNGEEIWSENFNGNLEDAEGLAIVQTQDGGYLICANDSENYWQDYQSISNNNIYLIKVDANGQEQWSQFYEERDANDMHYTDDGGVVIAISYTEEEAMSLLKIDENGQEEWEKIYEVDGGHFNTVQQNSDGGYIACGVIRSSGLNEIFLLKTNADGDSLWFKSEYAQQGESSYWEGQYGYCIQETLDGGYIIAGRKHIGSGTVTRPWIIKTNSAGDSMWSKSPLSGSYESEEGAIYSIIQDNEENYIACGTNNGDMLMVKTDANGETLWYQNFGELELNENGKKILQTTEGEYIIGGMKNYNNSGASDIYVVKTNEFGNITSTIELPTINKNLITTVDILGKVTNNKGFQLHIYDDGSVEKKYLLK